MSHRLVRMAGLLAVVAVFGLGAGLGQAPKKGATEKAKGSEKGAPKSSASQELIQALAEAAARGMTQPAVVEQQRAKAVAVWQRLFPGETPPLVESPHLILLGRLTGKSLKDVGLAVERSCTLAVKALELEREPPWPGKIAVFVFPERGHYTSFLRVMEARRAEEDENGTFHADDERLYAAATTPASKLELPLEAAAAEQIAAAMALRKGGGQVPTWVVAAFGRATALRAGPARDLGVEHRRALAILALRQRTVKDVAAGSFAPEENVVLRASLLEYLAYSGRSSKFLPFLAGFKGPDDNTSTFDAALKAAGITSDALDKVWQQWLRGLK